jgi:hypothetical protein
VSNFVNCHQNVNNPLPNCQKTPLKVAILLFDLLFRSKINKKTTVIAGRWMKVA